MSSERWMMGGDLAVGRIGYGAMKLTGWPRGDRPDRDTALAVLRRAVELGVDHLDTSNYYARDGVAANELIRTALSPYPEDLLIATKVGFAAGADGAVAEANSPAQLRHQIEENLRRLGRDHLDLVNLRIVRRPGRDSVAEAFGALAQMRDAGLVRHLGLSNVRADHLDEAQAIAPVVCVQNSYALDAHRSDDELVRICGQRGVAFVPFFALAGTRREAGAAVDHADAVHAVARAHDATPHQVRLAWTLHQGPHVLAIPGTGNPDHLAANIAAGGLRLTAEQLASLR